MTERPKTKYIHEGKYVAEVEVRLIEDETAWSPYLSLTDALRLDEVRAALRQEDLRLASSLARIYTLQPVAASH